MAKEYNIVELDVDSIIVKDRRRKEMEGEDPEGHVQSIEELAQSIDNPDIGLLHPIIVNSDNILIAGERRLRAFKLLKRKTIPAIVKEEIPEDIRMEMELEENIRRKNLTIWEESEGLERLYSFRKSRYGDNIADLSALTGKTTRQVQMAIQLARAAEKIPLLKSCDNFHSAEKLMNTLMSQELTEEIARREAAKSSQKEGEVLWTVKWGDSIQLIKEIPDGSVDIVVTDPPFGVGIESISKHGIGGYGKVYTEKDSEEWFKDLLSMMAGELFRVMKENSHIFMFMGSTHLHWTMELLRSKGFDIGDIPLIWVKSGGQAQASRPEKWFASQYEPIIFGHKGLRPILAKGTGNVLMFDKVGSSQKVHPLEKPINLIIDILDRVSLSGDTLLDPFMGSGVTIAAATQKLMRSIGFEIDETWFSEAYLRLSGDSPSEQIKCPKCGSGEISYNKISGTLVCFSCNERVENCHEMH